MKELFKIQNLAIGALVVIPLVYIPIPAVVDFFYEPKVYAMVLFAMIFLWYIAKAKHKIHEIIATDFVNQTLLALLGLFSLSLFFAEDLALALSGGFMRLEGYSTLILYFTLFMAARQTTHGSFKYLPFVTYSAALVACYGLLQHYGFDPFPRDIIRMGWQSAFSTMGNPNFLGTYLLLILPLALHLCLKKISLLNAAVYSLIFLCLLATRTNSAYVGTVVSLSFYGLWLFLKRHQWQVKKSSLLILLTLPLSLLVFFNVQTHNSTLSEFNTMKTDLTAILTKDPEAERAGSGRLFIWERVLTLIEKRPFTGYGIENLGPVMEREFHDDIIRYWGYTILVDKAHNEYLHIAVSAGIPTLFIYLIFLASVTKAGFSTLKSNNDYLPIVAAVLGYLVQALFNISVVSVAYVFWIYLGFLAGSSTKAKAYCDGVRNSDSVGDGDGVNFKGRCDT